MAAATAVCFLLTGCAVLLAASSRLIALYQTLGLAVGIVGWLGLSLYLFEGEPLLPYSRMAVHTAVLFLVVSTGTICARTDAGLMALLTSDTLGGTVARRLVPAAIIVPIILRWLRMEGQLAGWYGSQAGWSLYALGNVVMFGGLIWAAAALLRRSEIQRREADRENRAKQQLLQSIADGSLAVIYVKDDSGRYLLINKRYEELFHVRREEMTGKTDYDLFPMEHADAQPPNIAEQVAALHGPPRVRVACHFYKTSSRLSCDPACMPERTTTHSTVVPGMHYRNAADAIEWLCAAFSDSKNMPCIPVPATPSCMPN